MKILKPSIPKKIKQLSILTNNSLLGSAASYFLTIFLANHLGAERYGLYSYILVISSFLTILINYSTDQTAPIVVAGGYSAQRAFNLIFTLRASLFIISAIGIFLWCSLPTIVQLSVICLNVSTLNLSFLFEVESFNSRYSFIFLLERLVYVGVVYLLFVFKEESLYSIFCIYAVVTTTSILFQFYQFKAYIKNYSFPIFGDIKELIIKNSYLVVIAFSAFVYGGFSRLVIENKFGFDALGIFSSGMQITVAISIFQAQIERIWRLPLYTSLTTKNYPEIKKQVLDYLKYSTIPTVFIFLLILVFDRQIVQLVFTKQYASLVTILPFIAFFFILINFNSLILMFWIGLKKNREYLIVSTSFSAALLLTLYIIPKSWGLKGFVIILLVGQVITVLYSIFRLSAILKNKIKNKAIA